MMSSILAAFSLVSVSTAPRYYAASKDLEVDDDYPSSANTAALKAKHDKKLEK